MLGEKNIKGNNLALIIVANFRAKPSLLIASLERKRQ